MAQDVQIPGASSTARIRNPIAVAIFSVITLGIYVLYWWYSANREMVDYGRAKATDELGDSPLKSLLAVFPGGLIIVPALWTTVTTFQRVQKAQKLAGQTPINGWLGFVLYIVFSPAYVAYMQSGLNSVWETPLRGLARRRAARRPAERGPAKQQTAADEADAEEHDEPERRSGEGQRGTARRCAEDRTPAPRARSPRRRRVSRLVGISRGRRRALRGRWSSVRPRRRPQSGPGVGRRGRTESRSGEGWPRRVRARSTTLCARHCVRVAVTVDVRPCSVDVDRDRVPLVTDGELVAARVARR